jgi:hypothetical protein
LAGEDSTRSYAFAEPNNFLDASKPTEFINEIYSVALPVMMADPAAGSSVRSVFNCGWPAISLCLRG